MATACIHMLPTPGAKCAAKEIKNQHEDSWEIFPEDKAAGVDRYGSLYAQDYSLESIKPKNGKSANVPATIWRVWQGYHGHISPPRNNPHPSVMFMNWKVPSRLYNQDPTTTALAGTPPDKTGYSKFTDHRKVSKLAGQIPPSYLTRKTHAPTTTTHFPPKQGVLRQMREKEMEEQIMREKYAMEKQKPKEPSSGITRFPAMPMLSAKLNVKQTSDPRDAGVMPVPNNAVTMSGRIRSDITQEDKNYITKANKAPSQNETAKVVNKWLESASDKERDLAFQFFGSLAGKKLMGGDQASPEGRSKKSAPCNVCDATRLKDVLGVLKTTGGPISSSDKDLRPGESNRRRLRLLSPFTRRHKDEMQSWHHLPTFRHRGPVSNTIGLFTQPHKPVQRHFTIHPEWD
ncbi:uncharacterized protein LOC121429264 isoform X1 [Lytechinus variegatus]|uniref:uncharacterized protein LOC121429264 isoform X1 n=1 Tax=Lytechinus variegatus TaxID=7654 RepID=UPI001BB0FAA8|nr:uncharacterized protein LOC121429264 isoform X1 [Lytechinus variegatus]